MDSHDRRGRPLASEHDAALEELVFEYLERGESEGELALDALCRTHPELAAALRDRVAALRDSGLIEWDTRRGAVAKNLDGYRLTRWSSAGVCGVVFRAVRVDDGREVRVRIVPRVLLAEPEAIARTQAELERVRKLRHPAIVALEHCGDWNESLYAVSREEHATPLSELLARIGTRSPETLRGRDLQPPGGERGGATRVSAPLFAGGWIDAGLSIAREVARALAHTHAAGLAHGTLGAETIGLRADGTVWVGEFGWSALHGRAPRLWASETKAPERRAGIAPEASPADDMFALGVVLHRLLTLRLPVPRPRTFANWLAGIDGLEPASRRNAFVSADLERVLAAMLHEDRRRRYASMGELVVDLECLLAGRALPGDSRARRRWWSRKP